MLYDRFVERCMRVGRGERSCFTLAMRTALSTQPHRMLALVAERKKNKEIGSSLELSDKTVKNYIRLIFQKLNVTRRAQAAALFIRESSSEKRAELHPLPEFHKDGGRSR